MLRLLIWNVALDTLSSWSILKSLSLLIQMTAHAQFMELLFDNVLNFGIGFVAVKAHPHASIVNVVVVATDA